MQLAIAFIFKNRSSTKPTELICEYATKPNVTNGNHEVAWIVSRIHKLLQETLTELKKKSSADQTNDASGTWKAMSYILHEIKFLADSLGKLFFKISIKLSNKCTVFTKVLTALTSQY